jgi:hypothetical protein
MESKSQITTEVNNKIGLRGKSRIAAGLNVSYGFVEDETGNPVSGFRISDITSQMREIWRELESKGMAPATWGKSNSTVRNFFRKRMYDLAPELRLCENNWKLDHLATLTYPGWYRKHVLKDSGTLKTEDDVVVSDVKLNDPDEYMQLPQKRWSSLPGVPSKKLKKFKVPPQPKQDGNTRDTGSPGPSLTDGKSHDAGNTGPSNGNPHDAGNTGPSLTDGKPQDAGNTGPSLTDEKPLPPPAILTATNSSSNIGPAGTDTNSSPTPSTSSSISTDSPKPAAAPCAPNAQSERDGESELESPLASTSETVGKPKPVVIINPL